MTDIESPKNPRVAAVSRLHRRSARREAGRTILEGPHALLVALQEGQAVDEVFTFDPTGPLETHARVAGCRVTSVSPSVLSRLAGTKNPRGPVAVMQIPDPASTLASDSVVLVGVGDPGNAGTIIRSAAAFGFQVVVAGGGVDIWNPKVVRAAAGGHFLTRISEMPADPVGSLRSAGIASVAFVVSGGDPISELDRGPAALLIGSEPHGLPAEMVAACDRRVTLGMPGGAESLNASVAASIGMWERHRLMR